MNDTPEFVETRHAPRWLHAWAILTVVVTSVMLILGGLVTSTLSGMADPLAFTGPAYSLEQAWRTEQVQNRIEHSHRVVGFTLGGVVSILALGAWWTEAAGVRRWLGVGAAAVFIAGFGQFHGELRTYEPGETPFPLAGLSTMAVGLTVLGGLVLTAAFSGAPRWRLRLLATVCLLGVMAQGLLGSFRVKLNALAGTDLATYHGIFAQLVFCALLYMAVFTGRVRPREIGRDESTNLWRAVHWLVIFAFLQLIWGAWLRHQPDGTAQRLHLITAFVVVAAGVWLFRAVRSSVGAWRRLGFPVAVLGVLFALQITLGVEAWLGKFGTGVLPELQTPTMSEVAVRTAHTFIGTWILAISVAMLLLVRRATVEKVTSGVTK